MKKKLILKRQKNRIGGAIPLSLEKGFSMIHNFNIIKDYVMTLGGFEDSPKLDLQIQMIIDEALAYCYRKEVPEQMELPLADVIVTRLKSTELTGFEGDVSSYREGDMSVSFNTSTTTASKAYFNGKLEPFKQIVGLE